MDDGKPLVFPLDSGGPDTTPCPLGIAPGGGHTIDRPIHDENPRMIGQCVSKCTECPPAVGTGPGLGRVNDNDGRDR